MHEHAIASSIIEEAKRHGTVQAITIEVGDLAHLPADQMRKVLEDRVDWHIEIVERKASVECRCGYTGEPKILQKAHDATLFECPRCGAMPLIKDGDQIVLVSVEVDNP